MKEILVDTSVWIDYFKGNKKIAGIIHDNNNTIFITGIIVMELVQGLKTKGEETNFINCINALKKLDMTEDDWLSAGLIGNSLRKKGVTVPLPDLIIFHLAAKNNCFLFSRDKHFAIINETLTTAKNVPLL